MLQTQIIYLTFGALLCTLLITIWHMFYILFFIICFGYFIKKLEIKKKKKSKLWLIEYKVKYKNWDKKFVFALLPFLFLERIFHFIRHFENKKIHLVIIYHSFMSFLSVNVIYSFIQKGKWYSNSTKVLPFHFHFALLLFQLFSTQNLVMNLAVPNCST